MVTSEFTAPRVTCLTLPFNMLRALIFIFSSYQALSSESIQTSAPWHK
jgi:hypothetical protein